MSVEWVEKDVGIKKDVGKMLSFCPFDGSLLQLQRELLLILEHKKGDIA